MAHENGRPTMPWAYESRMLTADAHMPVMAMNVVTHSTAPASASMTVQRALVISPSERSSNAQ